MNTEEAFGNTADRQYLRLLREVMESGTDKTGRNGDTRGVFSRTFRHDLRTGFPVITTKKIFLNVVIGELLWFIEGGRNTGYRLSNYRLREILNYAPDRETIWSLNSERNPLWTDTKAKFQGDCGRIYGAQWRNWRRPVWIEAHQEGIDWIPAHWEMETIDQLANAIALLKKDPYNRRNIVTAWNPAEIDDMCLPPCHRDFQFFVEPDESGTPKYLSVQMNQRSCDMFLGVPFNIASYALLLAMVAQVTGLTAKELIIVFADAHIYHEHFDAVNEQLDRTPRPLPTLWLDSTIDHIDGFDMESVKVVGYGPHPPIKATLL